jgi:MoaA/NifB/PqqE/SkfB family radical SAM enzyme
MNNNKKNLLEELKKILELYKQSKFYLRKWLREIYIKQMIYYSQTGKRVPCAAGVASVYIDPYGDVYGCSQLKILLGNIRSNILQEILNSSEMKNWLKQFSFSCKKCLSGCEGITSIIQNLIK